MSFGVFGVVTTNPRTLLSLADRGLEWFAHFDRHQPAQSLFFAFENLGCARHLLRAIRERTPAMCLENLRSQCELRFDLRAGQLRESFDSCARGRIYCCYTHDE